MNNYLILIIIMMILYENVLIFRKFTLKCLGGKEALCLQLSTVQRKDTSRESYGKLGIIVTFGESG